MKKIIFNVILFMCACADDEDEAIEKGIYRCENDKGFIVHRFNIISEYRKHDTLIVLFSATVTSITHSDTVTDTEWIRFKVNKDSVYLVSKY